MSDEKKDKVLTVATDPDLYEAFKKTAKDNDRTMTVLVRDFMRDYVKKNGQGKLFD